MGPSPPTAHRSRKKRKPEHSTSNGAVIFDSSKIEKPAFPLVAFFWPAKGTNTSQWIILPLILMLIFLFRWCTGMWPYSGFQKPPMHGDFEAQRHWMELTANLPVTHWYFHDLEWWGLDYPPLTAYHSWALGRIGWLIEPEWFRLYLSRGADDTDLKVFMRATVVLSESLVYIPAAVLCVRQLARLHNINAWEPSIALTALLMQPATILVDHGHFQYNTVMLGFTLATIASMLAGRPLWSCVFFVGALGFKQMALFYAPAVAAYLAGICISPRLDAPRLLGIAIVTLASFAVLFLPLLLGTAYDTYRNVPLPSDATLPPLLSSLPWTPSEKAWYYPYLTQLAQAFHRIFPFSRGLFEDKVANLWCAIHTSGLHKLHNYDSALLSRAALGLTLASITPPCALLFFRPRKAMIPYAFAATAWGFFLCSYQVHEKNVLLPLLPMTLLLATDGGIKAATRAWVGFANLLACWTLFPLLVKDQLRIPYFVLTGLWAWLMALPPVSIGAYTVSGEEGGLSVVSKVLHLGVYATMVAWHVVEAWVPPPNGKPDLWVVANVCFGAAGFGLCYLWCLWRLVEESGLLSGKGPAKRREEVSKKKQ
ncbi:Glucosyltransferase-like protein [Friedmanniomyces endolithicus]|uniref:Alpha-1,3-glucosyltransferase n=1 Tax=Friedmanniomyces endolithicus TaxID=329885 RepID=A0AAN6QYQ8_9PEZI|nr:Glucosyltransferase-like protein [Friedmanniomyces endolithicus]KAK0794349.1 Glucosyltransferase-like protein [Friedmanniomyces endolithicus]KAK0795376.1 Glucosyltransferase-like protein [Friedmanniomyces endolithicus]KAK0801672.1 Glucosyltransferase-like protein [Friedmanniomyces endolithicus]KAK0847899.1 Glucosyltransferase-like protein [Friedmanniomyces endolithicus]